MRSEGCLPEPDARSKRFEAREQRGLRKELLVAPAPALGLVAMDGPNDPEPSLVVEDGRVVEIDGRGEADFDVLDWFLARRGIDLEAAAEAATLDDAEIARRLVDVDCPRDELVHLSRGLTPARLARIAARLDPVEAMFALKKLRARRAPANQAHVTNLKESPALLAADAAEAAARGFAELETTVGVSRYAPLNAIALLVGSQVGRPGVMTQCAVEERRNLQLAIQGLVTYAETLSVYGTEPVFVDGDDTPWSKAFLASAYASRGVKVRFTSGGGSEALMGHAEGKSMLYLEARCLAAVRAAGSQGVQNGSISCVALVLAVPAGTKEILAENLLAAWLDLEVASGNDAIASHSEIRKTAKLMGQLLPGTDFVTSGYSVMPREDNMFGGGNYDADDLDEWLTVQRDWQVDAGIEPVARERGAARARAAARGDPGCLRRPRLPAGHGGRGRGRHARLLEPRPARPRPRRRRARCRSRARRGDLRPRRRACARRTRLRGRRCGDHRHAAAARVRGLPPDVGVIDESWAVHSAVNDPNAYAGPGTGYRLEGERWQLLQSLPSRDRPGRCSTGSSLTQAAVEEVGPADAGSRRDEVVIAVGPAFGDVLGDDQRPAARRACSARSSDGVRAGGATPRLVRVRRVADVAFIGHDGADARRLEGRRSGCSRRGRRSSTAPTSSRSTTSSCSACRRSTRSSRTRRSAATRPVTRWGTTSGRCRRCWTTSRGRS